MSNLDAEIARRTKENDVARRLMTVPDFSRQSRRRKTLVLDILCRDSSGPMHLLIVSTGGHVGDAPVVPDLLNQIPGG